jgi:hypothetical protein
MHLARRDLRPIAVKDALGILSGERPADVVITMSVGQWDGLLSAAYAGGCVLLELDENEEPIRAYQRAAEDLIDGEKET